jgi:hypothetical protein
MGGGLDQAALTRSLDFLCGRHGSQTKAPVKPSPHTQFILDAMAGDVKIDDDRWVKVQESLDLLFAQVESIYSTQQQMAAQLNLTTKTMQQTTKDQFLLAKQMQTTGDAVGRLTAWQFKMEKDIASDSAKSNDEQEFVHRTTGPSGTRCPIHPDRDKHNHDSAQHSHLPKMTFPTFDGVKSSDLA